MINLTPEQRKILEALVNSKQKTNTTELVLNDLDLPKVMRKSLSSIAIRWTNELTSFKIYTKKGSDLCKPFFEVLNIIYFIKSLEDNVLVSIIPITNIRERSIRSYFLYDSSKYDYNEDTDSFLEKMGLFNLESGSKFETPSSWKANGGSENHIEINLDIVALLDRYAGSIIYPLPLLEDFVTDFKTVEQRRFDDQMSDTQVKFDRTMCWTRVAAGISFLGLLIALILPFSNQEPTEIKHDQINAITKTILDAKTVIPKKIEVFSKDTMKVKNIQQK